MAPEPGYKSLLIVRHAPTGLWLALGSILAVAVIALSTLGFVAVSNTIRINDSATVSSQRAALARQCWRANRLLADRHLAYRHAGDQVAVRRAEHEIPIVDCSPNFKGEAARPLPVGRQRAFVDRYARDELVPVPTRDSPVEHGR